MTTSISSLITQKKSCSHVLHAILTLLTLGFWIPVWVCAGLMTAQHNRKIDDAITAARIDQSESRPPAEGQMQ